MWLELTSLDERKAMILFGPGGVNSFAEYPNAGFTNLFANDAEVWKVKEPYSEIKGMLERQ